MLSLVGISVLLVWLDPVLAVIVLAGFVPLLLLTRWFQRRSRATYRRTRVTVARLIVQFVESMNGIRAVQAYRREAAQRRDHGRPRRRLPRRQRRDDPHGRRGTSGAARWSATSRWRWCSPSAALRVAGGALELGALTAFLLYLRRFYDPLDELAMFFNAYQSAAAALEKIAAVLDTPPDVPEPAAPVALPSPVRGELRFAGVRFAYRSDRRRTVLPELSTDRARRARRWPSSAPRGRASRPWPSCAARFYDPTDGGGHPGRRRPARCRRRRAAHRVAMITQEAFLFSGSVADNIALGRPDASAGGGRRGRGGVGARAFVEALPDGFDTDVRKRGGRLSAGQRQLVGLARVVLADPAVVLLDEATSSLDVPSERAVQAALETVLPTARP